MDTTNLRTETGAQIVLTTMLVLQLRMHASSTFSPSFVATTTGHLRELDLAHAPAIGTHDATLRSCVAAALRNFREYGRR